MRDDLTVERVLLLNVLGRPDEALDILMSRTFYPWEGGEGKVTAQYVASHIEIARRALRDQHYADAIAHLEQALVFPRASAKRVLAGAYDNHIYYFLGEAYCRSGDAEFG
ncbi:MAG: hypothetical protein U0703_08215 [Anaerolineae bacterium]